MLSDGVTARVLQGGRAVAVLRGHHTVMHAGTVLLPSHKHSHLRHHKGLLECSVCWKGGLWGQGLNSVIEVIRGKPS